MVKHVSLWLEAVLQERQKGSFTSVALFKQNVQVHKHIPALNIPLTTHWPVTNDMNSEVQHTVICSSCLDSYAESQHPNNEYQTCDTKVRLGMGWLDQCHPDV